MMTLFSYSEKHRNGDQSWEDSYRYTLVDGTDIQYTFQDGFTGKECSEFVTEQALMNKVNEVEAAVQDGSRDTHIYLNAFRRPKVSDFLDQGKYRQRELKVYQAIAEYEAVSADNNDENFGRMIKVLQILPGNNREYFIAFANIHEWHITTDDYGMDIGAYEDYNSIVARTYLLNSDFHVLLATDQHDHEILQQYKNGMGFAKTMC